MDLPIMVSPFGWRVAVARLYGDILLGDDLRWCDAHQRLAGDGVAPAVCLGLVRAHVACGDARGPGEHVVSVGINGGGAFPRDVGAGRCLAVHTQGDAWLAAHGPRFPPGSVRSE